MPSIVKPRARICPAQLFELLALLNGAAVIGVEGPLEDCYLTLLPERPFNTMWYSWVDSNHRPPDPQFCGLYLPDITDVFSPLIKPLFPGIFGEMVISDDYREAPTGVTPVLPRALSRGIKEMGDQRITKRLVDGLRKRSVDYVAWDSEVRGFGVRVRSTGAKSYVMVYRAGSGRNVPLRRVTLARVGDVTPEQARTLAEQMRGSIAHGNDPAALKAAERKADTLQEVADAFLAEHAEAKRKASTAEQYRDILERFVLPELGTRKAAKVTTADIAKLHTKIGKRTPYQANRLLAVVGSLYSFAAKRHVIPHGMNPARGIEKYPESGRERFLRTDELGRLGDAIREGETIGLPYQIDASKPKAKHAPKADKRRTVIGPHAAAAMRLLILTGARLREILHLKWDHVDFERGMLLLPDSKTGKKAIVLNAPALDVLANVPRVGTFVIAGQAAGTDDEQPRADLKRPWHAVAKRAKLTGVRIHDLRHTHGSVGAGAGLGLPIIGKLLGHAQAATTARYAHLDADPVRKASERIGSQLAAAMGDVKPANAEASNVLLIRGSKAAG